MNERTNERTYEQTDKHLYMSNALSRNLAVASCGLINCYAKYTNYNYL